jgi:hypothetical protein
MVEVHRRNPHIYVGGRIHRRRLMGAGMGSVLMNVGGAGSGSSYPSVADYTEITGRQVKGGDLGNKLDKLIVKPLNKKPHNIKFDI